MRCDRCHNIIDKNNIHILTVTDNLTTDIGYNVPNLVNAQLCPKCSHILRDWIYQNGDLYNTNIYSEV
jgi:hypothetical protein